MAKVSIESVALKWFFFTGVGSVIVYREFCHITFDQLGFSLAQIGFTTSMGVQQLLVPLFLLFADRFRARKAVAYFASIGILLTFIAQLLPLIVPFPTCFTLSRSKHSGMSTGRLTSTAKRLMNASAVNASLANYTTILESADVLEDSSQTPSRPDGVPWLSNLFLVILIARSSNMLLDSVLVPLGNLATVTYLKEERAKFGEYLTWCQVGACVAIVTVTFLAWKITLNICGFHVHGYFLMYVVSGCMSLLSLFTLPYFEFEYDENKTFDWVGVKSSLLNSHYVFILFLVFYIGFCMSFQNLWGNWYLEKLSGSPLLIGGACLIRRGTLAASNFISGRFLKRIGDLKTICVALFCFWLSFFGRFLTRIPWVVVGINMFQAFGYALGYCATAVHLSKAGSKESSGIVFGVMETALALGYDGGASLLGVLFDVLGTQITFLVCSISSLAVLVVLLLYIIFSKHVDDYEKLAQDSDAE